MVYPLAPLAALEAPALWGSDCGLLGLDLVVVRLEEDLEASETFLHLGLALEEAP